MPTKSPSRARYILVTAGLLALQLGHTTAGKRDYSPTPALSPAWTARLPSAVQWQRVTPMGQLVVATDCCLSGIDPTTGTISWTLQELAGLTEDSFEVIPATPLFTVETDGVNHSTLVIDSLRGHMVFDSRAAGIANVLDRVPLYDSGGLLVLGQKTGDPTVRLFFVETATGNVRWSRDDLFQSGSGGMKKLVGLLARVAQTLQPEGDFVTRPLEVGPDAFVVTSLEEIVKVSTATGKAIWRVPNPDGQGQTSLHLLPPASGALLVGTEQRGQGVSSGGSEPVQTKYAAYNLADGSRRWPKSIKIKGPRNSPVMLENGTILSPGGDIKGKIKYVEYATGKSAWGKKGKGIASDGGIVDHGAVPQGLFVTTGFDSAWSNRGTVYYLNVLDTSTGAYRFKKSVKVKGRILRTEILPRGVLYVTTHEVNILDPASGKRLLGEGITSESLVAADDGDQLYAFSRDAGALYRVDKAAGSMTKLTAAKVKLEGKDRPRALEIMEGDLVLVGAQHVIRFDRQGSVLFHQYYPAPRHPGWVRALMIAQSVRAGLAAAQAGIAGAAFAEFADAQQDGTIERELGEELARGYSSLSDQATGISADYARMAGERFQASALARDYHFMMVRLEDGYGIAQVSKTDGKAQSKIPIGRDETPNYQVDDVAGRVYYRIGDREIVGYAF